MCFIFPARWDRQISTKQKGRTEIAVEFYSNLTSVQRLPDKKPLPLVVQLLLWPADLYTSLERKIIVELNKVTHMYMQAHTHRYTHTQTHLIDVELALPSGEFSVAGAELSDKVVTTERGEEDPEQEQREYIKKNSSVWQLTQFNYFLTAHTDHSEVTIPTFEVKNHNTTLANSEKRHFPEKTTYVTLSESNSDEVGS